jgi:hypothetical protein
LREGVESEPVKIIDATVADKARKASSIDRSRLGGGEPTTTLFRR